MWNIVVCMRGILQYMWNVLLYELGVLSYVRNIILYVWNVLQYALSGQSGQNIQGCAVIVNWRGCAVLLLVDAF